MIAMGKSAVLVGSQGRRLPFGLRTLKCMKCVRRR
jgi:hypothetical protein